MSGRFTVAVVGRESSGCFTFTSVLVKSAVAQWKSAGLLIKGLQILASLESLCCVLEQDTLILA